MAEITLRQIENQMMAASDSNGHSIVIGLSPEHDGQWVGIKPSDLLLISVAACATYDVIEILNKRRESYHDFVVSCKGEQQTEPPNAFTKIHLTYKLTGTVNSEQLKRAIQLSVTKYCSVTNTLSPDVSVTSDFEITPERCERP
jgi:putative redox protein